MKRFLFSAMLAVLVALTTSAGTAPATQCSAQEPQEGRCLLNWWYSDAKHRFTVWCRLLDEIEVVDNDGNVTYECLYGECRIVWWGGEVW
ncbi:MAG: hypothetical protein OXQ32_08695 [bacterium]|nr:hypothetical protein [bacterium]MDE2875392.1 hypothetical protein [Gemmatimonadota bacterium]